MHDVVFDIQASKNLIQLHSVCLDILMVSSRRETGLLTEHAATPLLSSYCYPRPFRARRTNLIFGSRSFPAAAPTIWNSLPDSIRSFDRPTFNSFWRHHKNTPFPSSF